MVLRLTIGCSFFRKNHMVINVMVILPSGERPIVEGSAISGVKPGLIGGPKPSVDFLGEEVGTIATIKVAQTARCPDVLHAYESRSKRKSVAVRQLFGKQPFWQPLEVLIPPCAYSQQQHLSARFN